jgi:hypothetical protein
MQRPSAAPNNSGRLMRPLASMIDCVVSIIISNFRLPAASPFCFSRRSRRAASVATCSGIVIFGNVTTKLSGKLPPLCSRRAETKISSVRKLRARNSSLNGLMRMPMNGGSVPSLLPFAVSSAAEAACPSSSSSGRLP